jgi:integrase
MEIKLDTKTVAALTLAAGKTDQIIFDADLTGFGFRLRKDGARLRRTWIVQYRLKGRTRRYRIGDYPTVAAKQAREKAKTVLANVHLGQDPQSDREADRANGSRTFRATANEYLEMKDLEMQRGKYSPKSYRLTKLYLTKPQYFGPLHSAPINDITVADIASRLNTINRNSGAVTAGRARSALSSVFTWAMQQGFMGPNPHNPASVTKNPDDGASRDRVLEDTEMAAIWKACRDNEFGKIVKLLMLTACRREEVGGLRWSEIDQDKATITLPKTRTKNKHEHMLPLTPMAVDLIGSIPQRVDRDHLFGDRSANGFTDWGQKGHLAARVELAEEWTLHDIRRSVATWMAEHGNVEPHIIEAILNHYSGHRKGVAGTYNRARYAVQMRAALRLWDDHLRSLIQGGRRKVLPFPTAASASA